MKASRGRGGKDLEKRNMSVERKIQSKNYEEKIQREQKKIRKKEINEKK